MIVISLLEQWLIHIPLLLGSYISFYVLKVPDLSIESSYTFGAFCAAFFIGHYPAMHPLFRLVIALSISCIAGGFVGALSSGLKSMLGVSHLLATIITSGILYSLNQYIIGSYYSIANVQNPLASNIVSGYPELISVLIISIVCFLLTYIFLKTDIGMCTIAYGINNKFFKHYGISSVYIFIVGVVMANCLAGISGYVQAQCNGFVDITMGFNKSLLCLIALIFGKTIMHSFCLVHLGHAIVGGFMYFCVQYTLIFFGFNSTLFTCIQAIVICIMLAIRKQTKNDLKHSLLGI